MPQMLFETPKAGNVTTLTVIHLGTPKLSTIKTVEQMYHNKTFTQLVDFSAQKIHSLKHKASAHQNKKAYASQE